MNFKKTSYFKKNGYSGQPDFNLAEWECHQYITRFIGVCLTIIFMNDKLYAQLNDSLTLRKNPFHVQLQYAGNLGLGSIGVGKSFFNENLSLTGIYGYLPKKINTVAVHTIALKTSVQIVRFAPARNFQLGLYSGISFMYGLTENTFVKLPDWYPDEYYPPIALHASIFAGINHNLSINKWNWTNLINIFAEIGSIEYQLYNAVKNKNLQFADIVNLSAGISIKLARIKQ